MYHKTGSSVVIEDLHKLGHGLSYTETKFVEGKWAEWAENESTIVASNIEENIVVTHAVGKKPITLILSLYSRKHLAKKKYPSN